MRPACSFSLPSSGIDKLGRFWNTFCHTASAYLCRGPLARAIRYEEPDPIGQTNNQEPVVLARQFVPQSMKTHLLKLTCIGVVLLGGTAISHGDTINLVGNDGLGTSSFNSGQNWAGGAAPSATNDYNTSSYQMRTPGNTTTAYTFGGASLTLGNHSLAGSGNGSLLEKFSSGAGSVRTLTINNLTNAAGGLLRSGGTAGALIHIAGNHFTIAGNSSIWADQCIWVIDSPLIGGDSVILTNFANNANDHVAYSADNSQFTGSWYLTDGGNGGWSVELDALNSLPGKSVHPQSGPDYLLAVRFPIARHRGLQLHQLQRRHYFRGQRHDQCLGDNDHRRADYRPD